MGDGVGQRLARFHLPLQPRRHAVEGARQGRQQPALGGLGAGAEIAVGENLRLAAHFQQVLPQRTQAEIDQRAQRGAGQQYPEQQDFHVLADPAAIAGRRFQRAEQQQPRIARQGHVEQLVVEIQIRTAALQRGMAFRIEIVGRMGDQLDRIAEGAGDVGEFAVPILVWRLFQLLADQAHGAVHELQLAVAVAVFVQLGDHEAEADDDDQLRQHGGEEITGEQGAQRRLEPAAKTTRAHALFPVAAREQIAFAAHGLDPGRRVGVVAQLAAQP